MLTDYALLLAVLVLAMSIFIVPMLVWQRRDDGRDDWQKPRSKQSIGKS